MKSSKADGATAATLARFWNVSVQQFHRLAAVRNFPSPVEKGRWPALRCTKWFICHLQSEIRRGSLAATADELLLNLDPGRTLQ